MSYKSGSFLHNTTYTVAPFDSYVSYTNPYTSFVMFQWLWVGSATNTIEPTGNVITLVCFSGVIFVSMIWDGPNGTGDEAGEEDIFNQTKCFSSTSQTNEQAEDNNNTTTTAETDQQRRARRRPLILLRFSNTPFMPQHTVDRVDAEGPHRLTSNNAAAATTTTAQTNNNAAMPKPTAKSPS